MAHISPTLEAASLHDRPRHVRPAPRSPEAKPPAAGLSRVQVEGFTDLGV